MGYTQGWNRWIKLSIAEYFKLNLPSPTYDQRLFVEGQPRKTNQLDYWIELRTDGPKAREQTKDFWRLTTDVNVLVSCNVDNKLHHVDDMMGDVATLLFGTIGIFKYGGEAGDDPTISVGCLTLERITGLDNVVGRQYGQIQPKVSIVQAVVEARYYIEFP